MSAEANIVERLVQDHQQLSKMSEAARVAGRETGVRVRDTSALLQDLDDAVAEITKLRAERDAAARNERIRCAKHAMEMAGQILQRAQNTGQSGMISQMLENNAKLVNDVAKALLVLPDSVAPTDLVIATSGKDAT